MTAAQEEGRRAPRARRPRSIYPTLVVAVTAALLRLGRCRRRRLNAARFRAATAVAAAEVVAAAEAARLAAGAATLRCRLIVRGRASVTATVDAAAEAVAAAEAARLTAGATATLGGRGQSAITDAAGNQTQAQHESRDQLQHGTSPRSLRDRHESKKGKKPDYRWSASRPQAWAERRGPRVNSAKRSAGGRVADRQLQPERWRANRGHAPSAAGRRVGAVTGAPTGVQARTPSERVSVH